LNTNLEPKEKKRTVLLRNVGAGDVEVVDEGSGAVSMLVIGYRDSVSSAGQTSAGQTLGDASYAIFSAQGLSLIGPIRNA
jgi:hypothetical protein